MSGRVINAKATTNVEGLCSPADSPSKQRAGTLGPFPATAVTHLVTQSTKHTTDLSSRHTFSQEWTVAQGLGVNSTPWIQCGETQRYLTEPAPWSFSSSGVLVSHEFCPRVFLFHTVLLRQLGRIRTLPFSRVRKAECLFLPPLYNLYICTRNLSENLLIYMGAYPVHSVISALPFM